MYTIEELKQYLIIDQNVLNEELIRQPQLFADISDHYAEAISRRDLAKQVLEQLDANLANEFRANSIEKVTDSKTENHVKSHPNHVEQHRRGIEYQLQVEKLAGDMKAFIQRNDSLKNLVQLFLSGYYGTNITINPDKIQSYSERYKQRNQNKA